jgi:nicotinamidase-related amidase
MTAATPLRSPTDSPCAVALLLIDFIGDWCIPERAQLLPQVERAIPHAVRLLRSARRAGVPVIYANDNFGQWRSDFGAVWNAALAAGGAAAAIASAVAPQETDYRVLKPKHSAFFGTPLDLLLQHLGASTVVLCGIAGNQCVMATAIEAHMRDYMPVVAHDASASRTPALHRQAMAQLADLGLSVVAASSVRWKSLLTR